MAQAVPNLCVYQKVFLKHHVNCNTICVGSATAQYLACGQSCWGFGRRSVPAGWTLYTNQGHPFMHDQCRHAFASNMRLIFVGPVIAVGLTGNSLSAVKWELLKPTRRPSVSLVTETGMFLWMSSPLISGGLLLNLQCSARVRHWLSESGVLMCESVGNVAHLPFVSKSYHLFLQVERDQASLVRLGPVWWHCPIWVFPLFLKRTADVLASCLSVVFRRLVRLCSFSDCWRQTNVTTILKALPSSSAVNYRPISIT